MSRASGKNKDASDDKNESGEAVENEEEDSDEIDREETPDLYRNSALGMCVTYNPICLYSVTDLLLIITGMVE